MAELANQSGFVFCLFGPVPLLPPELFSDALAQHGCCFCRRSADRSLATRRTQARPASCAQPARPGAAIGADPTAALVRFHARTVLPQRTSEAAASIPARRSRPGHAAERRLDHGDTRLPRHGGSGTEPRGLPTTKSQKNGKAWEEGEFLTCAFQKQFSRRTRAAVLLCESCSAPDKS